MYTRPLAGLTLSATLLLAACAPDNTATPVLPTEASFASSPTGCSFSVVRSAAKAYYSSSRDPIYTLIDAMQTAHRTGGASGAQGAGFAVLGYIGSSTDVGGAALKGTPAQGSTLANSVLACMSESATTAIDFSAALGPSGLFAVRGGTDGFATSRGLDGRSMPLFGVDKTGATWHGTQTRILFYGYERPLSQFTSETGSGASFELRTVPAGLTFAPPLNAGICTFSEEGARILHEHASNDVILPLETLPSYCVAKTVSNGFSSSMMQFAATLLLPQKLQAATAFRVADGGGGLLSGLSPFGAVTFNAVLSFSQQPTNSLVSKTQQQFTPAIAVKALSAKGTPLKGVTITLEVAGNEGSFTPPPASTAVTGDDGIATFPNYYLDKAGGYTLIATAGEFGKTVLSNLFQINGK